MKIEDLIKRLSQVQEKIDLARKYIEKIDGIASELEWPFTPPSEEKNLLNREGRLLLLECPDTCDCPLCKALIALHETTFHFRVGKDDYYALEKEYQTAYDRLNRAVGKAKEVLK